MRKTKALVAAAAAIAAVVPLAACGSETASAAPDDRTVVRFWQNSFQDWENEWYAAAVEEFNESHDEIWIEHRVVPGDVWEQNLQAAQAAGEAPDVTTTSYGIIASGQPEGRFAEMSELLSAEAIADIKDNVAPMVTFDGGVYGFPLLVEPSAVLFYRTDLVEQAGLNPDVPPTTWDELIIWAETLRDSGVMPDGMHPFTIASTGAEIAWSSWGLQVGNCDGFVLSDDWASSRAQEECFAQVAEFYQHFFQNGLMSQQPIFNYTEGEALGQETVAMQVTGSWAIATLKQDFPEIVETMAVAPMPSREGNPETTTATMGGWSLTIDSMSQVKAEAATFIETILRDNTDTLIDYFAASGFSKFPALYSIDEAVMSTPDAQEDPFVAIINDQIVPFSVPEPTFPWDISLAVGNAIESVMKNVDSVEGSFSTANDLINTTIEQQQLAQRRAAQG